MSDSPPAEAKVPLIAIPEPASSADPPSLAVISVSHPAAEPAKTTSGTSKPNVGVSLPPARRAPGTRLAPAGSSTQEPSAAAISRPIRLEDVLNERR
jgi:hypothetical protein